MPCYKNIEWINVRPIPKAIGEEFIGRIVEAVVDSKRFIFSSVMINLLFCSQFPKGNVSRQLKTEQSGCQNQI